MPTSAAWVFKCTTDLAQNEITVTKAHVSL
jgi:hypothetical protein